MGSYLQREQYCEIAKDTSVRKHVLIVDDDVDTLKILRVYLRDDYKVSVVNSGEMAEQILISLKPDVVLLDYLMPGLSGAQVLKDMRKEEGISDIPVFFLTGQKDEKTIRECLSCHPAGYIVKPIAKLPLLQKLRDFFDKGS